MLGTLTSPLGSWAAQGELAGTMWAAELVCACSLCGSCIIGQDSAMFIKINGSSVVRSGTCCVTAVGLRVPIFGLHWAETLASRFWAARLTVDIAHWRYCTRSGAGLLTGHPRGSGKAAFGATV